MLIAIKNILDSSVRWAVANKLWTFFAGPITILLIVNYLTKIEQGYFYIFLRTSELVVFGELGIASSFIYLISKKYASLKFHNNILTGKSEDLFEVKKLLNLLSRFVMFSPILIFPIIYSVGVFFLIPEQDHEIVFNINVAWLLLCFSASIALIPTYLGAHLEGFNLVSYYQKTQFYSVILRSLTLWFCFYIGLGLLSLGISLMIFASIFVMFYVFKFRSLILNVMLKKFHMPFNEFKRLFKFQKKVIITWIFSAQALNSTIFFVFYFFGPSVTGQFGMSLAICELIYGVSFSIVLVKMPYASILVEKNKFNEASAFIWRRIWYSLILGIILAIMFLIFIYIFNIFFPLIRDRLLSTECMVMILIFTVLRIITDGQLLFMRANLKENSAWCYIISSLILMVGLFGLGADYGIFGFCIFMAVVRVFAVIPLSTYVYFRVFNN